MELVGMTNTDFAEELFREWQDDPESVPAEWRDYFTRITNGDSATTDVTELASSAAASAARALPQMTGTGAAAAAPNLKGSTGFVGHAGGSRIELPSDKQGRVDALLWAYRDVGAIYADLNPLGNYETPEMRYMRITVEGAFESLSLEAFGLGEEDLDTEFYAGGFFEPSRMPLRDIVARARQTYLSTLGIEFLHVKNRVMRRWILEKVERSQHRRDWSDAQKIRFQKDLIKAEEFERFVHSNFIGQKRFSLEGGEGLIPALHYLIYTSVEHNVQEIVVGMAHRGRLNVFTNAM
ncbi:MAG TPA: hypothetical protein VJ932_03660, partial [Alkalispirochaeta sp.]|nr:hypothetical protein [Alkalispirochaeta sp.]